MQNGRSFTNYMKSRFNNDIYFAVKDFVRRGDFYLENPRRKPGGGWIETDHYLVKTAKYLNNVKNYPNCNSPRGKVTN